jgi:tetratricopeptide (TPR) repeat protein/tRNA A-37 threonylcarbamoyl transferase component Bud32/TolB-like protein
MTCPRCGATLPPEAAACATCGEPLPREPAGEGKTDRFAEEATRAEPAPTYVEAATREPGGLAGADLRIGSLFAGRYEVQGLIGQGGMGRVYRVRDRSLDKVIALKTLRADNQEGLQALQRFKQELLLARKITHKNVIRIHDLGEADGITFFTMEFIHGESLDALIHRLGRIPPEQAVSLSRQILSALAEAHAQGVIHRDLKPQNVMVDGAGNACLMDFGIARAVDSDSMTASGMIIGTPDYISPEQVKGERADAQSDLFSYGVILYRMLTGELPYQADSTLPKIMMRLTQRPRAPRELAPDVPKHLDAVVRKCLEVDKGLRYRQAADVIADLEREQVAERLTLRVQRAVARSRRAAVAGGLLVLGGAIAFAFALRNRTPAAPAGPVQPRSLAILPFANATGAAALDWMRTGLPEMLATDLAQSQYVRPVPGDRVFRVLGESGLGEASRFDEAALDALARRTHADAVLTGQFVESGGTLRLDLGLRRSGTGVTLPLKVEGQVAQVFALVDACSRRVKGQLDLGPGALRGDADRPLAEVSTASLEARRAYEAGVAALRRGEGQQAVAALEESVGRDPGFVMAQARLAEAQFQLGQDEAAAATAARARTLAETAPLSLAERHRVHAIAATISNDSEAAAKTYAELARLYPEDPDVQLSLAQAEEQLGRLPEAREAYAAVVRLEPGYGAALLGLGRVQVMSGEAEQAARSLQDALATRQFDEEPEALGMIHSILGVAYRETGRLDEAQTHLETSLAIRRKSGNKAGQGASLQNLASIFLSRGEVRRAHDALRQALALYRELGNKAGESKVMNDIGIAYQEAGDLDKGLASFRESLQIEMEREDHVSMANRLDHIADVYRQKGRYDDALVYLEQARSHLEKTDEAREKAINFTYTGQVRMAQGSYKEAVEAFLSALPLNKEIGNAPGEGDVHLNLGQIYESQGRYADAQASYQQGLELYGKVHSEHDAAHAQELLAHLLTTLGSIEAAERALEAAAGGGAGTLLGRARLALLRGERDRAAELFGQANVKANLSRRKQVAVESRVELGRLYLVTGKLDNAERLLQRTRLEAAEARLRPLEAEAAVALAEVQLAKKDARAARRAAEEAIGLAEKFSGRPVAFRGLVALAAAHELSGSAPEALDALARAAAELDWIRGSLPPNAAGAFRAREDVKAFLDAALPKLEQAGRTAESSNLRRWLSAAS